VLTDNGKQFTDRFGRGGEVLFDRICRDNGITHRLTQPRSPTTTGKVERFHGSLRRELTDDAVPFADLAAAQAAVDAWVREYNTSRPHQGIGMAVPASRFTIARARAEPVGERHPSSECAVLIAVVVGHRSSAVPLPVPVITIPLLSPPLVL
jgi:transposase InsO family protein